MKNAPKNTLEIAQTLSPKEIDIKEKVESSLKILEQESKIFEDLLETLEKQENGTLAFKRT